MLLYFLNQILIIYIQKPKQINNYFQNRLDKKKEHNCLKFFWCFLYFFEPNFNNTNTKTKVDENTILKLFPKF